MIVGITDDKQLLSILLQIVTRGNTAEVKLKDKQWVVYELKRTKKVG